MAQREKDKVFEDANVLSLRNQIENLKNQLVENSNELDRQHVVEERLRRDIDRNKNQDIGLRKERDKEKNKAEFLAEAVEHKDQEIERLKKYCKKYEDKALKMAKEVESIYKENRMPNKQHAVTSFRVPNKGSISP